jgi:undecaprenyl-diphosphatase
MLLRFHAPASKLLRFIRRHQWSLPLALVSAASFAQLASEVYEGEDIAAFDETAMTWVTSWRGDLDGLMLALTTMGDFLVMTILATVVVAALVLSKHLREAQFMIAASFGTLLLNQALKLLFQRARPETTLGYLVPAPSTFSFPSGHAMGSVGVLASLLVLAHVFKLKRAYRLPLIALTALVLVGIALSRVYFGVHYPSDVIGGQFAGAAWVSAVTGWFYPRLLPGERATTRFP